MKNKDYYDEATDENIKNRNGIKMIKIKGVKHLGVNSKKVIKFW